MVKKFFHGSWSPSVVSDSSMDFVHQVDEDNDTSINSLKDIMEEERQKRKVIRQRNLGCYTQFSGTFTRFSLVIYPPE